MSSPFDAFQLPEELREGIVQEECVKEFDSDSESDVISPEA